MQGFQYTPVMFCHLFSNSSTVTKNTENILHSSPRCSGHQHLAIKEGPQLEIIPELLATLLNPSAWCDSSRKQGCKKMPWFADILTQEATRGFFVHLSKRAHSPPSGCVGSLRVALSEIPGPWCSSDERFECVYTLEAKTPDDAGT